MTVKAEYKFYPDGTFDKVWKNENGQVHRDDGPAIEYFNGIKHWFKNGTYHRKDGPAMVCDDGSHEYYLNGKEYSKDEYWKK